MRTYSGKVIEIQINQGGKASAWVDCPPGAIPSPGQYLMAISPDETESPLGTPLFLAGSLERGFLAAPPVPPAWNPGVPLELRGPLGEGFRLPSGLRRLSCAAFGDTASRLLPLATEALGGGSDVALFSDAPLPRLPATLEVHPLGALRETLDWPDLLALDLPGELLPGLRQVLGLDRYASLPCPVQALVWVPMPCAGIGECGACAVPGRREWKLACIDGPVFNLEELEW